ncbi:AfsR/SARP family transcriptional regulator [Micromonospora vulcania]|uniref:BTAD domain-containing putative transcriptional regulator n=1 Tax=Micromonospora vulcania TaxID=1441873 RepID=A0ABW1H727_9ACTN
MPPSNGIDALNWTLRANGYASDDSPDDGPPMRYRILGPVEVYHDGRWTSLRQAKCRALLAALLANPNQVVPADDLRRQLWSESPPRTAGKLLQHYVYQVRRSLGDAEGQHLATRPPGYQLIVGREELDADRFADLTAAGHRALAAGAPEAAADHLRRALALWRGPALGDIEDVPAADAEATRLEEVRLLAMEAWIEAELACDHHTWLVPPMEALVVAHPLRERLRVQLMLALYRSGRQTDALALFHDLRRTLRDELGLNAGVEAQEMYQAILRGDPDLLRPETPPVGNLA